jgi:integrase
MFLETLSQAPTTKRTILSFVKSALNEICDDWHLMRIPFPSVSIPYREQRWIRREDQDAIIDELLERDRPIFRLLRAYGCRISEACALMWDCVDLNHKRIVFRRTFSGERYLRDTTKTGYHRHNPMSDAIVDMLRPLRLDISSQFVFKNCHGNHYRARSLNDLWKRACRRAQHEYINIENAFRHSKNMQLKAAGFDLKSRSDFLGHRNVRTTEIYEEVDFEAQRGMVG